MNESVNTRRRGGRHHLFMSVSSIALLATAFVSGSASAGEPALWIDLSAQSEQAFSQGDAFALPPGIAPLTNAPLTGGLDLTRGYSGDGRITFRPGDADWVFSASVTYGRSRGKGQSGQVHQLPTTTFVSYYFTYPLFPSSNKTRIAPLHLSKEKIDEKTSSSESNLVLDFTAGKDVGIGMFGRGGTSVFSAGVRFAHFTVSRKFDNVSETNGIHFVSSHFMTSFWPGYGTRRSEAWNTISGSGSASLDFAGFGPSLSWDASMPLSRNESHNGVVTLDWGINAALLFGKQKYKEQDQLASAYNCYGVACETQRVQYAPHSGHASRPSKNVTVPNLGGFIGASYRVGDVKASIGYKADWFFGVFNTGLMTSQKVDRGFFGPFLKIGIGIGD